MTRLRRRQKFVDSETERVSMVSGDCESSIFNLIYVQGVILDGIGQCVEPWGGGLAHTVDRLRPA